MRCIRLCKRQRELAQIRLHLKMKYYDIIRVETVYVKRLLSCNNHRAD